jgi:hypothetical protein
MATAAATLPGLISRLDYLARLGVTCLWLNPIHPSPHRDDGYDVADYYAVDPRLGTLGDFAELALQAGRTRHPAAARPGGQPHIQRAPLVSRRRGGIPPRRTGTGTCGVPLNPLTAGKASCSPASRPRPGASTRRPGLVLPPLL